MTNCYRSDLYALAAFFILNIGAGMLSRGFAQGQDLLAMPGDSTTGRSSYVHGLGLNFSLGRVLPTDPFYMGDNKAQKPIKQALSGHLKYSFQLPSGSLGNKLYADTYQGVGAARFNFGNAQELGNPIAIYLFQGAKIASLAQKLSLGYEWNFGLSGGWKPNDFEHNPYNVTIGSRINAYINAGLFLKWKINQNMDVAAGADITHFSNGNTAFPNAGLNIAGANVGFLYHIKEKETLRKNILYKVPAYKQHLNYDLVFFGAWRRKGVEFFDQLVASPEVYPVIGGYFAPMYNFGYRFRAGVSLDGIYDGSANVYTKDYIIGTEQEFFKPDLNRQMALGLSARAEYVMPLFSIAVGMGGNVLHKGGDLKGTYQTFALKIGATRNSFLHIGYNLKDFHEPNFLMLGFGFRLRNHSPSLLH